MIETIAGQLSIRQVGRAPSPPPFAPPPSARTVRDYHLLETMEDLASDSEECEDDGELSDSRSSRTSRSSPHPITPQLHPTTSLDIPRARRSRSVSPLNSPSSDGPRCLAHKAERILGLTPGTLSHARACLENARDEVRRLSEDPPRLSTSSAPAPVVVVEAKEKMSRTKKTMSVLGLSNVGGNKILPGVVLGAGGKDEEMRREKRRRAADGVLYWQKEVGRLQAEETAAAMTLRKGRR